MKVLSVPFVQKNSSFTGISSVHRNPHNKADFGDKVCFKGDDENPYGHSSYKSGLILIIAAILAIAGISLFSNDDTQEVPPDNPDTEMLEQMKKLQESLTPQQREYVENIGEEMEELLIHKSEMGTDELTKKIQNFINQEKTVNPFKRIDTSEKV